MNEEINNFWYETGHFNESQRDYFIELLSKLKPKTILEIGWATGRSCITALIAGRPDKMISIDINLDYMNARDHATKMTNTYLSLQIIEADSKKILKPGFFLKEFRKGIDFAFIDGDHSYKGCYSDIASVYPYINYGGILIIDDYCSELPDGVSIPAVTNAVDDFASKFNLFFETWYSNGKGFAIFKK